MRFKMRFEGEEAPEKREKRVFSFQWDDPSSMFRPERVSPWELEPLVANNTPSSQPQSPQRNKRPRPPGSPSPTTRPSPPAILADTCFLVPLFPPPAKAANKRQTNGNVCRLFGVDLVGNVNVDDCFSAASLNQPVPSNEFESSQQSEPLNINQSDIPSGSGDPEKSSLRPPQESQSRQIRSCTKVHMQGCALGRAVDLTKSACYEDLFKKLEEMFKIEGELLNSTKIWQVVYTNDEDDMMMVGDVPWNEFCGMVRKIIIIYTPEEVKELSPKNKLTVNARMQTKTDAEENGNTEVRSSSMAGSR